MFGFGACKACGGNSDQQTDTVKVSFSPPADACDKENAAPHVIGTKCDKIAESEEEQRRGEAERQEEEERLRQLELERQRAEVATRERRLLEEQRACEAERQRQQEEEARRHAEEVRQQEEARRSAEEARKQEEIGQFLSKNGFGGVNEKKKKSGMLSSGFTYPLHAAVKAEDTQVVALLLWGGADRSLKDSAKLTPFALAQKLDKKGSHRAVMDALAA